MPIRTDRGCCLGCCNPRRANVSGEILNVVGDGRKLAGWAEPANRVRFGHDIERISDAADGGQGPYLLEHGHDCRSRGSIYGGATTRRPDDRRRRCRGLRLTGVGHLAEELCRLQRIGVRQREGVIELSTQWPAQGEHDHREDKPRANGPPRSPNCPPRQAAHDILSFITRKYVCYTCNFYCKVCVLGMQIEGKGGSHGRSGLGNDE